MAENSAGAAERKRPPLSQVTETIQLRNSRLTSLYSAFVLLITKLRRWVSKFTPSFSAPAQAGTTFLGTYYSCATHESARNRVSNRSAPYDNDTQDCQSAR